MSDFESQLRAADPLHALTSTPIDLDAMKSRVTSHAVGVAHASQRRQMKVLSFATVAVLVTTVTLVSLTSNDAVFHGSRSGWRTTLRGGGASVIYGTGFTGAVNSGTKAAGGFYAPESATRIYAAGAGLSAPVTSGPVYKLNAFSDAASEAQHLASIFGVSAAMASVPSTAFAAEYQAGDMSSSTGSVQYFIARRDAPDAGLGTFQFIADGAENWSFNGPITSSVDPATATKDVKSVDAVWSALDTGFTLSNPTWMVTQLTPQSNAVSTSETQVNFTLSINGNPTFQVVQFTFDDTGKLVYAEGPNLSIVSSVTFPFQAIPATIDLLNAGEYGDCSPTFVATGTSSTASTNTPTTTTSATTETLDGVSLLYQPEEMSNGQPWLVPFYQFTDSDGKQSSAPFISTLGPAYFNVRNGSGTSCAMTLTQP
jgi:hypothetical protein